MIIKKYTRFSVNSDWLPSFYSIDTYNLLKLNFKFSQIKSLKTIKLSNLGIISLRSS